MEELQALQTSQVDDVGHNAVADQELLPPGGVGMDELLVVSACVGADGFCMHRPTSACAVCNCELSIFGQRCGCVLQRMQKGTLIL